MRTHNANVMFYAAELWLVQIVVNQTDIFTLGSLYISSSAYNGMYIYDIMVHGDPPCRLCQMLVPVLPID